MIVATDQPAVRSIEREIERHRRDIVLTDAVHFQKFYGEGFQIYVLIVTPLKAADRETAGYFEGVYKVPPQTMAEIKNRILLSLLQVVVIIFFTTLAVETADVILVRSNPLDVVAILKLSRATYRKMMQNLLWATCPKCNGSMRIISFIESQEVIKTVVMHLDLWTIRSKPPARPTRRIL